MSYYSEKPVYLAIVCIIRYYLDTISIKMDENDLSISYEL